MDPYCKQFFLCHAGEDKKSVVAPLFKRLVDDGYSVWYDEAEIKWGDSITEKVNWGLSHSKFVIVVLSATFLKKHWPSRELNTALDSEASSGEVRVLPLLVGTAADRDRILSAYPLLADKRYVSWEDGGIDGLVYEISRLAIVHRMPETVEIVPQTQVEAELAKARVSITCSSLRPLDAPQNAEFLIRPRAIGVEALDVSSVAQLSQPARRQFEAAYLSEAFARMGTELQRSGDFRILLELNPASSVAMVAAFAEWYQITPQRIGLLFPEAAATDHGHEGHSVFSRARRAGFEVGISCFGTGFSSLSYLRLLHIQYLVLDKCFTADIRDDPAVESIVHAVGALARALDFTAVGSNVRTDTQLGCFQKAGFALVEWRE